MGSLPPYKDHWIEINPKQNVKDIIREILESHEEFAPYYDRIALYFDGKSIEDICNNIDRFLKKNIRYKEESDKDQTTAIPAGILTRGSGDCKHFASFAGGILDALNRRGAKIPWCYRFASYKLLDKDPHHVFICVDPGKDEIWIDPTPGATDKDPVWIVDEKVNTMALRRNIAGADYIDYEEIDYRSPVIAGYKWQLMPMEGARGAKVINNQRTLNPYFSGPFLALQHYKEDPYSVEGTNWQTTTDAINTAIQKGPEPGHTVDKDFVQWIYTNNLKGWNFYYKFGVQPGYAPNLPANYPRVVITEDLRLDLDRDQKVDDYMNDEIQALTAWAQDLINQYDKTPYPLTPQNLKLFSQGKDGPFGKRDLMKEHRGKSFLKEVGEFLGKAAKFVVKGVMKIVGSIPRNAFLGLVGINFANFAGNLQEKIDAGHWDKIANKWKKLGGNPSKLLNTINDGKKKKAILGSTDAIGEPATAAGASAWIAAAAPIIAAMLAFIKDKDGKVHDVLQATKAFLQTKMPNVDFSPLGFLDKDTGKEIEWTVDQEDDENYGGGNNQTPPGPVMINSGSGNVFNDILDKVKSNPMLAAGGAAAITYFLTNGNGKKNYLLPAAAGIGVYFLLNHSGNTAGSSKLDQLITWANSLPANAGGQELITDLQRMSADEIDAVHQYIFQYFAKNIKVPAGSNLYNRIDAISKKYNIFT